MDPAVRQVIAPATAARLRKILWPDGGRRRDRRAGGRARVRGRRQDRHRPEADPGHARLSPREARSALVRGLRARRRPSARHAGTTRRAEDGRLEIRGRGPALRGGRPRRHSGFWACRLRTCRPSRSCGRRHGAPAEPAAVPVAPLVAPETGEPTMPDLAGRSLRQALALLAGYDLDLEVVGRGLVVGQAPSPAPPSRPGASAGWSWRRRGPSAVTTVSLEALLAVLPERPSPARCRRKSAASPTTPGG